jgi:RNA polymerase sigma-70 factor, ECF subfamily
MQSLTILTDGKLIRRIRNGDEQALTVLHKRYEKTAYAKAYSIVKNPEDAQEVTQDAFTKAFKAILYGKRDKLPKKFKPWILTITTNCAIDLIRKRILVSIESIDNETIAPVSTWNPDPLHRLLAEEACKSVALKIKKLPEKCREVVRLKMDGLGDDEIAKRLNISKATVRSQMRNGRKRLKKLKDEFDESMTDDS